MSLYIYIYTHTHIYIYNLFVLFSYLGPSWVFVAAHRLSLIAANGGYSPVAACGLLIAVASLVSEHGLLGTWAPVAAMPKLSSRSSQALEHRFSSCGTQA